jgi:hypothetical protein
MKLNGTARNTNNSKFRILLKPLAKHSNQSAYVQRQVRVDIKIDVRIHGNLLNNSQPKIIQIEMEVEITKTTQTMTVLICNLLKVSIYICFFRYSCNASLIICALDILLSKACFLKVSGKSRDNCSSSLLW